VDLVVSGAPAARPAVAVRQLPFAGAIGLSAFLLFSLELLAGRLVLPVFGGSPAVWTTSLCFFTTVLFVGYLYAHVLVGRLPAVRAAAVHLVVALLAVVATVLAPSDIGALRNPALPEAMNVLLALAVVAGGPALLLATTTPLLSDWYAGRGGNPWWLYATSNGASFLALLAYPFLVEPTIPLSAQRLLFAGGLVVLTTILAGVAAGTRQSRVAVGPETVAAAATPAEPLAPPTRRRQALWLVAAFVPAGLLSATTNYLQTDLISAPLIWVGPLAIYLASFVVAFSNRGRRWVRAADRLVPAAATLLWVPFVLPGVWPVLPLLAVELGALFVLAVAIHGHLADDLPDERHVTRFYLVLSAGGMLATAFVALGAPLVFSTVLEYPLLIVAGVGVLALLPATPAGAAPTVARARASFGLLRGLLARIAPYAAIAAILVVLIAREDGGGARNVLGYLLLGLIAVMGAVTPWTFAGLTTVVLAIAVVASTSSPLLRVRTFFGVIEVRDRDSAHLEISGTTLHGVQFQDARRDAPTTYYVRDGSVGQIFGVIDRRLAGARIGVVGLGVGTIAAYARPTDSVTFYEIDQAVVDIARDPASFTFLADAATPPRIVVGDARLSILDEPAGAFDILILDAFSSDSVPAHLLTREAVASYQRVLAPGGLLVFHLSNRYYDLPPAVGATVAAQGLDAAWRFYQPTADLMTRLDASPSVWLVAGSRDRVARYTAQGWTSPRPGPVLTDDYSDLLRTLRTNGLF
jgi:SAM-dependent methyltransferase